MRRPSRAAHRLAAGAVLALALSGGWASAHKLKVFATAEGAAIRGYVYFPGGGRAKGVKVVAQDPSGARLGETTTDGKGEFALQATVRCDHTLVAETLDGHKATFVVEAADLPEDLPPLAGGAPAETKETPAPAAPSVEHANARELKKLVEEAVARELRPLREQLEGYEARVRVHEVIGGIGYIVGVCGVVFYLLARRKAPRGE